jgi:hypothetical protein
MLSLTTQTRIELRGMPARGRRSVVGAWKQPQHYWRSWCAADTNTDRPTLLQEKERQEPGLEELRAAIAERQSEVDAHTRRINEVTDRIFGDFSTRVGVGSIREFEETHLAAAEAAEERMRELASKVGRTLAVRAPCH